MKLAVRDDDTFWLSSGDWNNANQPRLDPVDLRGDAETSRTGAIATGMSSSTNKPLADAFRAVPRPRP